VLARARKMKFLSGERQRERVVSAQDESRCLNAAGPLLRDVAVVPFDTGMRPAECHRMRWEQITWFNGRYGTIRIPSGKTKAAKRTLPMTPRLRTALESRWILAGKPDDGWVWPAPTQSGDATTIACRRRMRRLCGCPGCAPSSSTQFGTHS
jgi:integrase